MHHAADWTGLEVLTDMWEFSDWIWDIVWIEVMPLGALVDLCEFVSNKCMLREKLMCFFLFSFLNQPTSDCVLLYMYTYVLIQYQILSE